MIKFSAAEVEALVRARDLIEDLATRSKKYRVVCYRARWEATQIYRRLPTTAQIMLRGKVR